ncbi:carboxypeptidase-like regulatory domain-containing protein [bacterium]|nr:carboxypeptidase-like regulatory domain-containing protein [bacterium]
MKLINYFSFSVILVFVSAVSISAETISGQVLDYYGTSPVNGVTVQCLETTGADSTIYRFTTDSDGLFSVAVPPATYYICVNGNSSNSLYVPQYYGGVNYSAYSYTVLVSKNVNVHDIIFYMYAGFKLHGKVSLRGQPIEADIIAYDNTTGALFYGLTGTNSGADGTFNLTVPQGTYVITAYADGHIQPAQLSPIVINDGRDISEPIELEIPVTASVNGVVSGPAGDLIEEVRVDAFDTNGMYSYSYGLTDENGKFSIHGLEIGRTYKFLCRTNFNPGYAYWDLPGTWYPESTEPATASAVTVAPGGHTNIDIELDANGGSISGLVTDLDGTPIKNAYVYDFYYPDLCINPYSAIAQRTLYTSENGVYTLTGIAGTVGIAVTAHGFVPQIYNDQNMTTLLDTGDPLTMTPGAEYTDINFRLTPVDTLGSAPVVTSIIPHLIIREMNQQVTITGTSFSPAATIDIVDFYPFHLYGNFPDVNIVNISTEEIQVTVSVDSHTATSAYYLAITNPDGQYTMTGFVVIDPEPSPTLNLLAAPEHFSEESTLVLSSNISNLSLQSETVDGYIGLVLPTGDAIFYDGITFSMDLIKYFDAKTLEPGLFSIQTLEFEIPLDDSILPTGEYLWFAGLFEVNTWDLLDLSIKIISTI